MSLTSTKCYGHEVGLSCAFRQWRAASHCRFLHGYALSFKFVFGCTEVDENGWVVDFGGLKELKSMLQLSFDHKTVIAASDPGLGWFQTAHTSGALDLVILEEVGCEEFAKHAFELAEIALNRGTSSPKRTFVISAECSEHGANSAKYTREGY